MFEKIRSLIFKFNPVTAHDLAIKALNIKNMILVTRSKKKVIGLEGYGIKITKQEIIK